MSKSDENLIWIDLEMTGLDSSTDRILEVATIVTDKNLNELAVGPILAISQELSVLSKMDQWNTKQHTKSGLVERVKNSSISENDAEKQRLNF